MTVTGAMAARDAQWARDVAAGPEAMAARRAEYAAAGWKMCEHPTCPPFDCRALACRDCHLAGVVTETGKVKGERDVDPCPAGDDDFHHWTGVAPTDCANLTHDHDAIISEDGGDPTTNVCNGCPRLAHYDRTQEWYFHDTDDGANDCFLSGPNVENPCYTHDALAEDKARCQGEPWPERHSDTCLWCRHLVRAS